MKKEKIWTFIIFLKSKTLNIIIFILIIIKKNINKAINIFFNIFYKAKIKYTLIINYNFCIKY